VPVGGAVQFRWQSTADCIGFSFRKRIRYSSFCTCDTGHPGGLCGAEQRNGAGKQYEPVTVVVSVRLQNLDAIPPFVREIAHVRISPVRHFVGRQDLGSAGFACVDRKRKAGPSTAFLPVARTSVGMTEFSRDGHRSIPLKPNDGLNGAPKVMLGEKFKNRAAQY
jgi:hypothetical protein